MMTHNLTVTGPLDGEVIDNDTRLDLTQLCRACGTAPAHAMAMVREGVLEPVPDPGNGHDPHHWRFDGDAVRVTRTAVRLSRDLDLSLAAVALVLELLRQVDTLRGRLARLSPHDGL